MPPIGGVEVMLLGPVASALPGGLRVVTALVKLIPARGAEGR